MEPSSVLPDPALAGVRARRATLHAAMIDLEVALAAPAAGRAGGWGARVQQCGEQLKAQLLDHIRATEGPQGFHEDIRTAAPRLAHAVAVLSSDHQAMTELAASIVVQAAYSSDGDVENIRELGTELLSRLSRHRQRGADLIYEAYETDIGGGD